MAIKDIISPGIGFSPGSPKYIVTRGFGIGVAIAVSTSGGAVKLKKRKKRKKEFTEEEIRGLEAIYGKKTVEVVTEEFKISEPKEFEELAKELELVPIGLSPFKFKPLKKVKPEKKVSKVSKVETKVDIDAKKIAILEKEELEEIDFIITLVQAHDPLGQ